MMAFKKLGFLVLFLQTLLFTVVSAECGCPYATSHQPNRAPQPVGTIPDQTIFANSTDCGPNNLYFDVTPYFDSSGEALTYCLSSLSYQGDISNLTVTLNPFTGILTIPVGWFAVFTAINLHIVAKNPYGSATQHMKVNLDPCGG